MTLLCGLDQSILLGAMGAGAATREVVEAALAFNMTDAVRLQDGASIIGAAAATR